MTRTKEQNDTNEPTLTVGSRGKDKKLVSTGSVLNNFFVLIIIIIAMIVLSMPHLFLLWAIAIFAVFFCILKKETILSKFWDFHFYPWSTLPLFIIFLGFVGMSRKWGCGYALIFVRLVNLIDPQWNYHFVETDLAVNKTNWSKKIRLSLVHKIRIRIR